MRVDISTSQFGFRRKAMVRQFTTAMRARKPSRPRVPRLAAKLLRKVAEVQFVMYWMSALWCWPSRPPGSFLDVSVLSLWAASSSVMGSSWAAAAAIAASSSSLSSLPAMILAVSSDITSVSPD
ncbi:hypothetical protein BB8028_0004g10560 [Beauveria bassiana]|uniref:Uncharacterized protein n=1 Tax=Beauveria bassiana TaxID=176275 RepID=A0A2S7YD82_BEABA|nr:hypothetical protein BB8028_0004g10560 [Beauveria bassiana]